MVETELGWEDDYRSLTEGAAWVKLDHWTQVTLIGKDRAQFLHNMCTNDIRSLSTGQMCEAYCTDVKGKIVAHVTVFAEQDSLSLLTVPGQATHLIEHLDHYLVREDVQLDDESDRRAWLVITGPQANSCVNQLTDGTAATLEPGQFSMTAENSLVANGLFVWLPHWLVRVERNRRAELVTRLDGLTEVDEHSPAWQALRIESQWPRFGVDFDGSALPQEINRDDQTIHLNKGCYLGQETVARIDALGHVNKKLVLVQLSGSEIPEVGTMFLRNGQEVGKVTSACWSPRLAAPLAFAFVRRGTNEVGTKLEGPTGTATVVKAVSPG